MKVTFWGTRGSIPVPGPSTLKYGGNTSCVSVESAFSDFIILDGGSGLRPLGNYILTQNIKNKEIFMFFSHVHWDHIQGIPFFKPLFINNYSINMYGEKKVRTSLEETLKGQQQYPNFPISLEEISITGARMKFTDIYPGQRIAINKSCIEITCTKLSHPDGVLCYRIEELINNAWHAMVYATDTEHRSILDPRLLKIAKGAELLIYDAQYTPDEYAGIKSIPKFDWGHSTYEVAVDTALEAGVKNLVLFHHDPEHDDYMIDEILEKARKRAEDTGKELFVDAAAERTVITI